MEFPQLCEDWLKMLQCEDSQYVFILFDKWAIRSTQYIAGGKPGAVMFYGSWVLGLDKVQQLQSQFYHPPCEISGGCRVSVFSVSGWSLGVPINWRLRSSMATLLSASAIVIGASGAVILISEATQLILPVHSQNVTKNLTAHRMHVAGPQIYQINHQTNSFQNMYGML